MRQTVLLALLSAVWLMALGCTASDRDFARNHIAVIPARERPTLAAASVQSSPLPRE